MRNAFALFVLVLSAFGPGASWAGYCVQVSTLPVVQVKNGNPVNVNFVVPVASQPGDMSTCALVLVSGTEWANLNTMSTGWTALNNQVTTNKNNITSLQSSVSGLQSSVSTLNSNYTSMQSTVGGYQNSMQTLLSYQSSTFDLSTGLAAFAFFFSTVLFFYSVAKPAGAILETIKNPLGRG